MNQTSQDFDESARLSASLKKSNDESLKKSENESLIISYREGINARLHQYLDVLSCHEILKSAMMYSVNSGGKRIRPLLLTLACNMFGGSFEKSLPFACAVELIHTYSLIHDDLPAMDDDDMRRGNPSNHKVFGEWAAILAGDGLLNLAYEIMTECCAEKNESNFLYGMAEIARAAGARGMVGGQAIDMDCQGKDADAETIAKIYANKTGALIAAPLVAGAIIAGASNIDIAKLRNIGQKLGLAFQIKDDILNVQGDPLKLGKPIGTDCQAGKATYVSIYGLERVESDYFVLCEEIAQEVEELPNSALLKYFTNIVLKREN